MSIDHTNVDDDYDPEEAYDNPDVKEELDEKRRQLQQHRRQQRAQEAADVKSARESIAAEEQPDPGAPDLRETYTLEFRGHEFEFYELGDVAIEAAQFQNADEDVEAGTEAAAFVYRTVGQKCKSPAGCDEAYWREYDFEDVMGLFFDLVDAASDLDEEEVEEIDEFRNNG